MPGMRMVKLVGGARDGETVDVNDGARWLECHLEDGRIDVYTPHPLDMTVYICQERDDLMSVLAANLRACGVKYPAPTA